MMSFFKKKPPTPDSERADPSLAAEASSPDAPRYSDTVSALPVLEPLKGEAPAPAASVEDTDILWSNSDSPSDPHLDTPQIPGTPDAPPALQVDDVTPKLPRSWVPRWPGKRAAARPDAVPAEPAARKSGLFGRKASPGFTALPIKVILGYFPDISHRDAFEYAQGIAEKHFEQPGMVHYGAFEYDTGYIYEVHEGGEGLAFTPAILKYFKSQGPFKVGENLFVTIKTATRLVEVQRLRNGISAILLPEATPRQPTPWLRAVGPLTPALNRRSAFFKVSATVFASGILTLLVSGTVFRLQPYDLTIGPKVQTISTATLPRTQWSALSNVAPGFYVKALRYRSGKWEAPELTSDGTGPASPPFQGTP